MTVASKVRWEIEEFTDRSSGATTYDVRRAGRAFAYDLDSQETAERRILKSKKFDPSDEVFLIPHSGSRRRIRLGLRL